MNNHKFNVVVMSENGYRCILTIRNKSTFSERVALREARDYHAKHKRPARIVDDTTPLHTMDDFVRGYLEAALWSSNDDDGTPLDHGRDVESFSLEAVERAHMDCDNFRRANRLMLKRAYRLYAESERGAEWTPEALAGHDFWLTRNGHGAGFWDRGFGAVGDALATAARAAGEVYLFVSENGKVNAE